MFGFTLNHTTTSASLSLRLTAPVELPAAVRTVEDVEVEGRAGTLTRNTGWANTVMSLSLAVKLDDEAGSYRNAAHALTNATTISFSAEAGCYRRIKHAEVSPLRRELVSWGLFDVDLTLEPFTYLETGRQPLTLTKSGTITNPGLLDAAPIITVFGTGTLTLTINGTVHQVKAPSGQVTLDSARLVAHVAGKVQTDALTGPFPTLTPGINRITLGTGISRVEITPNWRNP